MLRTAVEAKTKMEGKAFSLMSLFNKNLIKKRHFVEVPYSINKNSSSKKMRFRTFKTCEIRAGICVL